MKSLEELANKYNASVASQFNTWTRVIPVYELESLINEVISQRLGEPVFVIGTGWQSEQHMPNGTPLYALNIES